MFQSSKKDASVVISERVVEEVRDAVRKTDSGDCRHTGAARVQGLSSG